MEAITLRCKIPVKRVMLIFPSTVNRNVELLGLFKEGWKNFSRYFFWLQLVLNSSEDGIQKQIQKK